MEVADARGGALEINRTLKGDFLVRPNMGVTCRCTQLRNCYVVVFYNSSVEQTESAMEDADHRGWVGAPEINRTISVCVSVDRYMRVLRVPELLSGHIELY